MAISADGNFIALSQDEDQQLITVWDMKAKTRRNFPGMVFRIKKIALSVEGTLLAVADSRQLIVLRKQQGMGYSKIRQWLTSNLLRVERIAISADSDQVIAVSFEGVVQAWSIKTGLLLWRWKTIFDARDISSIAISAMGQYAIWGTKQGVVIEEIQPGSAAAPYRAALS